MRVTRAFQQVLLAHRLPEQMDADTRSFASKANVALSQLQDGKYAVFDLRWSITQSHAYGMPGEVLVLDEGVKILSEAEFEMQYRLIKEPGTI